MDGREPNPKNLSDEPWKLIRPVITTPKAKHPSVSDHEDSYAIREIINTTHYQAHTRSQ
jgi:transposase